MYPITSYRVSNIFNITYLFSTNPGVSQYSGSMVLASILFLLFMFIAFIALRKKRDRIKLNRDQRLGVLKAMKLNMLLSGLLVFFVCARSLFIPVLSMRVFPLVLISLLLGTTLFGVFKMLRHRNSEPFASVTSDEYAKYLPRKKKK